MKNNLSHRQVREQRAAKVRRVAQQALDARAHRSSHRWFKASVHPKLITSAFKGGPFWSGFSVGKKGNRKPLTAQTKTVGYRTLKHPPVSKGKLVSR